MAINKKDLLNVRNTYVNLIKCEMLGPGSELNYPDIEHEIITESPEIRYSLGILYPKNDQMKDEPEETGNNAEDVEEIENEQQIIAEESEDKPEDVKSGFVENDNLDEEISLASQNKPSSFGLIFFAKGSFEKIHLNLKFATYRKTKIEECGVPFISDKQVNIPNELSEYVSYDQDKNIFIPNPLNIESCKQNFKRKKLKDYYDDKLFDDCKEIYDPLLRLARQISESYIRIPHDVNLDAYLTAEYNDNLKNIDNTHLKITTLKRKIDKDLYSISLMVVNDTISSNQSSPEGSKLKEDEYVFQPLITISTTDNDFVFSDYGCLTDISKLSDEDQSLAMQYRNKKNYATGMGTSVKWSIDDSGKGTINNDFFPMYEVPQMDFAIPEKYGVSGDMLKMKLLSDLSSLDKGKKISGLKTLTKAYDNWIRELNDLKNSDIQLNQNFDHISKLNIENCNKSLCRMNEGIDKLINDDLTWQAFELANRAMYMQRVHLKLPNKIKELDEDEQIDYLENIDYRTIDSEIEDYYSWRPFQLAFILINIISIVDDKSDDRNIVDLIWFPTGGGKTEAYLGLTAFSIFYRKLKYPSESDGTCVMMRYTLRLLTAQQFTRASTLICACECIRKDAVSKKPKYKSYKLGDKKITIGLWIGSEHTPNKINDAKTNYNKLIEDIKPNNLQYHLNKYNKFQVLKCPWCGKSLVKSVKDGKIVGDWGYSCKGGHFKLICPQEGCHFNTEGELPIQIVDEELYNNPPTLLFGTVDKFAMLAWNPKIGSFFGVNTDNRAPELIIQDELHLISGPLGTIVGAYETVIDTLCKGKGSSAKIIASTATIRGAKEQCSALYNREVMQFPNPGLNADDSFFAKEQKIDYKNNKYGRLYIGAMASGKSKAMIEDRTIAALLERIDMLKINDEVKDKFWTLTIYFNSLKELGKCSTLIEDDVKEFIGRTASRFGLWGEGRYISRPDELTSRITTTDLNETLNKLEKVEYHDENDNNNQKPSDVVLATNMISVGIDISRLNVMLVVSQPKLTSEYIQATSRVGREYPGVAIILYDGTRSRDRSHFEQFQSYHSSFYKYVEPTGITPFSEPSRDRTLASIVIALLRNMEDDLKNDDNAGNFDKDNFREDLDNIKTIIKTRSEDINSRLKYETDKDSWEIDKELEDIFEKWDIWAEKYKNDLIYGEKAIVKGLPEGKARLLASHGTVQSNYAFESMTSMRNVDTQLEGKVLIWEDDYD